MANHCYNFITITGKVQALSQIDMKFKKVLGDAPGAALWYNTYSKLFPDTDKSYPGENDDFDVYDEYGSKWFDAFVDYTYGETSMIISGDSAWSPMEPLCKKLSQAYKVHIDIEFEESGCDFGGKSIYENGKMLHEECHKYDIWQYKTNDCFMENLEQEINDDYYDDFQSFKTVRSELFELFSKKEIKQVEQFFKNYENEKYPI